MRDNESMRPGMTCPRLRRMLPVAVLALCMPLACMPGSYGSNRVPSRPATSSPPPPAGSWSLVVMPDTQGVVSSYPEILYSQTAWIAANADRLDIKYVVHEGDITNDSAEDQWDVADHAFRLLDDRVPYAVAMGNHDYPGSGHMDSRDTSRFDHHFPKDRAAAQPGFVGSFDPDSAVNAVYSFTADGQPWLIFTLEFGPRDAVLDWVASVLATRPAAQAILVTHAYLFVDGTRFDHVNGKDQYSNPHDYDDDGRLGEVNDAQEMWDKLIAKSPAIRFVLCGHMHAQARLESQRPGATTVQQILADYQAEEQGGAGTLRLMTFTPDGRVIVRSYSPFLDSYRSDDDNEFEIKLETPVRDAGVEPESPDGI